MTEVKTLISREHKLKPVTDSLGVDLDELFDGFDPDRDDWDKRLLYEVTGTGADDLVQEDVNGGEFIPRNTLTLG